MSNFVFKSRIIVLIVGTIMCSVSCKKNSNLPVVITISATAVTTSTATAGGNVTDDGGSTVTARGVCWSVSENPEVNNNKTSDGNGTGEFTSNLTNLGQQKRYFVRAYATNSAGTAYGKQVKLVTKSNSNINFNSGLVYDTIYDIDGNAYKTIKISLKKGTVENQDLPEDKALEDVWMIENLKVETYNDGSDIPYQGDNTLWKNLTTPAFCFYLPGNTSIYGTLYNSYAVNTGKLCMEGFHVPTFTDWVNLMNAVGGENVAGGKLKEEGLSHWIAPNTGATNISGFTGLPGGFRESDGKFYQLGRVGVWYGTMNNGKAIWFELHSESAGATVGSQDQQMEGYSVRCVKNR